MKKILDKKLIVVNAAILVIGIVVGIIFLIMTSSVDKLIVKSEITDFFEVLESSHGNFSNVLTSFKNNLMYISVVTISSIVYIMAPLILFINFYKGLLIGFLVSSVIMTYKIKGILYSLLIIFPHHILMALVMVIYSSMMLHFSYKLARGTYKNESINLKTFIKKIGILYIVGVICCFVSSFLEIFVCPLLIKLFI